MANILEDMEKHHDFLVCVDSDGCVFDNMELKHKECFCPATVNVWGLQGFQDMRENVLSLSIYILQVEAPIVFQRWFVP